MKRFIYPAIFYKDDDCYRVLFPDLELTTDGKFVEEAYLYATGFLKEYFIQVLKYDFDYNEPTDFLSDIVMLVEASIDDKKIK